MARGVPREVQEVPGAGQPLPGVCVCGGGEGHSWGIEGMEALTGADEREGDREREGGRQKGAGGRSGGSLTEPWGIDDCTPYLCEPAGLPERRVHQHHLADPPEAQLLHGWATGLGVCEFMTGPQGGGEGAGGIGRRA